jgi:O-antigen biosynthesis protein WbqV
MHIFRALNTRKVLIILHDLGVTAFAVVASFYIRFESEGLAARSGLLTVILPVFVAYAGLVYYWFGLYESKWRFASLPDLSNIFRAVTLLAASTLVFDYVLASSTIYGHFFFGKITIALYWCLQMLFLGGPRISYRYFRYTRARRQATDEQANPCLVLGRAADAELVLRAIENGAVKHIWPYGILSPSPADQNTVVRNVRVLGTFEDLEAAIERLAGRGRRITQVILTPSALEPQAHPERILGRAQRLGVEVRQLAGLAEADDADPARLRVTRIAVEDLLLRPTAKIDYRRLEKFVRGKAIVVTGGGGSIGADICKSVVGLGASRLLVIENSEPALRAVLDQLETLHAATAIDGRIADVRDRSRMFRLLAEFRPDLVFHAAALKHVPMVEREWAEGVRTNVFGSVNVADAAVAAGARTMVLISTDKAIEPVSVLGATKRLAEMYCQALDDDLMARAQQGPSVVSITRTPPTRLISVRFGNVLASNGSVVPRFKAQIEAGGPVTVTDPEMMRYFMTIREACDLVITAASHAAAVGPVDGTVYVLNMGQPVKILDLAERMIRLAGYEPRKDIDIMFTGVRPGERLHETLFGHGEPVSEIGISGIVAAKPSFPPLGSLKASLAMLEQGVARDDRSAVFSVFEEVVPDFSGEAA